MENLKAKVLKKIKENHKKLIKLSDYLADNPEVSGEEYNTVKVIGELLKSEGFEFTCPYADLDTAFIAKKGGNQYDRKIAIIAEYDALPKLGHACGHNVSGSISVLAGLALAQIQDELKCQVHIIGAPVEETDGAKCKMADQGVFDGYDMAMMIHLYNCNVIEPKIVCLSSYKYIFHGKSAHSSDSPWDGKNALNGAQLFMHGVDMLRQHVTKDVQMHGVYRDGGAAPNIVPDSASIEMYLRANTKESLLNLITRVENCAKGAAIATETTYEIQQTANMYLDLRSSKTGTEALLDVYEQLGLKSYKDGVSFGSSDIGNVSYKCPTFHPTLAIVEEGQPLHTIEFEKATRTQRSHEAISIGAQIISMHAIKFMTDESLLATIKKELGFLK